MNIDQGWKDLGVLSENVDFNGHIYKECRSCVSLLRLDGKCKGCRQMQGFPNYEERKEENK